MTSREQIFEGVRKALGRQAGQKPAAAPAVRLRIPEIAPSERLELFRERLEALGGKVYHVQSAGEACGVVRDLTAGEVAVASNSPLLEGGAGGFACASLPNVLSGFKDEPSLRAACATAPFGITAADYGLAETGTIVTMSSSEARLISLLPPAHIALLPAGRLLTGLDEFYSTVPLPAGGSASTVFITGPSRSADIEMILVRGVHGPRIIHVIVIGEEPQ